MPNKIDRNSSSASRMRRNFQRIAEGAVSSTLTNKIGVIAPITGGGPIKNNPSIGISQSGSTTNGYLSSTDWNAFHSAALSTGSYLSTATQLGTTAPITGGGYLSTGLTLSMPQAGSTTNGWLSSTDWNKFNSTGGGSTAIIAADASILIGSSTGSTTVAVQEQSGGGITTSSGGIAVALADHGSQIILANQIFSTAAQGTQVGTIGGAGATWFVSDNASFPYLPTASANNSTMVVAGASTPRTAVASTANAMVSALWVPSLPGLLTAQYTVSIVAELIADVGFANNHSIAIFVRTNQSAPGDNHGVAVQFWSDGIQLTNATTSSSAAFTSFAIGTGLHTLSVTVAGNTITAAVDGTQRYGPVTVATDTSNTGIGFAIGSAMSANPQGVQSFTITGGAAVFSGLTLSPPNLSILIPSTSVLFTSTGGLDIHQATSTTSGFLSSTDWNVFDRIFGASGSTHQFGNVPDPGSTAGSTRFLREDATWATPSGGGGGSPGGSTTDIQFNSTGAFTGNGNFTTDGLGHITLQSPTGSTLIQFTSTGTIASSTGDILLSTASGKLVATSMNVIDDGNGNMSMAGGLFNAPTTEFFLSSILMQDPAGGMFVSHGSGITFVGFIGGGFIQMEGSPIYLNSGGGTGGGTFYVDGGLVDFGSNAGGTPTNTTTPAGWLQVKVSGTTSYIPYYR